MSAARFAALSTSSRSFRKGPVDGTSSRASSVNPMMAPNAIVVIVCHAARQSSDGFHFLRLVQLRLQFFLFGDIGEDGGESVGFAF